MDMMKETIHINSSMAETINHYLTNNPQTEDECQSENDTIFATAKFPNGNEVDVKCCGVQFEEGECNSSWTEAVLFDERGCELCYSEPSDEFVGTWELEYDGIAYVVNVVVGKEKGNERF